LRAARVWSSFVEVTDQMNRLHLLVGVKAEQSLRDVVREAIDRADEGCDGLELAPVGRKDWIAGVRVGSELPYAELARISAEVLGRLIALDSRQRIRQENVRVYVVQPPVPVFRDPEGPLPGPPPASTVFRTPSDRSPPAEGASTCPICGRTVHSFNLQHDTRGRAVGCYICGGDPSRS
jgi:hypothetical protein